MAPREELIASAVTFLQDPSVASSPIEKRVAFLQSKNLTQEEVDVALARAGEDPSAAAAATGAATSSQSYPSQQVAYRPQPQPPQPYGYPPYGQWQPPPEPPKRDWRDWFIMATVMGGVGYGLYFVGKRYIAPLIAPPTPPQLEQDKENIDHINLSPNLTSKPQHEPSLRILIPLMGTESYTYLGRNFSQLSINDASSSSAFSDCNSDRSGEFATASSQTRRFLITCATENSDDLIRQLVADLHSASLDDQKQAAMEIRLLAKNKPENRLKIAKAGAIKPLISLISSPDLQLQEYGVTAILNLSLCDENKEAIASSGAIKPLVRALSTGTATAKENAACALLRLSQVEENKAAIGRSGAIPALVSLLESGGIRAKKDASTALYSLCTVKENKLRAVKAGIMKVLVELMADFESNMVDKSAYVVSVLVTVPEARAALVEEGGVPVLVEIVEVGTQRQKEIAVVILLQVCEDSVTYRSMVAREGAIPPLVALSQSGTNRAKQKAEKLIELLRQPRSSNGGGRASELAV